MSKVNKIIVRDLIESPLVDDRTEITLETEYEIFEGKWFDDFIQDNMGMQLVKIEIDPIKNSVIGTLKEI